MHGFCDRYQVGLVRLQEPDQRREKLRLAGPRAKLICPDSGQVKEPPRPTFVGNSSGESKKRDRMRVGWRWLSHRLDLRLEEAEQTFGENSHR